jgi:hypothetical protein
VSVTSTKMMTAIARIHPMAVGMKDALSMRGLLLIS